MRVLVATDGIGALSSARAGAVLADGWSGAKTAVLPLGEAGGGFLAAQAERLGVTLTSAAAGAAVVTGGRTATAALLQVEAPAAVPGPEHAVPSRPLGTALAGVLDDPPATVYVDLTGLPVHDAGAGLLAGLGATADRPLDAGAAALAGTAAVDLAAACERLRGVDLVGVVPAGQVRAALLGLRGITSLAGRAAGTDPAGLLALDAALADFARTVAPELADAPGAGACGGLGFAVLALGGRLATGPDLAFAGADLAGPDLLVTGCSVFDFATRGGGVVAAVADRAATGLQPCIVVAGEVVIGAREMRTMGVEAAYAVRESRADRPTGGDVTAEELAATARRVARSWSW